MRRDGPRPSSEALGILYSEAKRRADAVAGGISEIDDRIEGTIRFNVLLLGLVITGLSFATRTNLPETPYGPYVLVPLIVGTSAVVASTTAGVVAYLKKGTTTGIDARSLVEALEYGIERDTLRTELIQAYELAVAEDEAALEQAAKRFRIALYALVTGVASLCAGTIGLFISGLN